MATIIKHKESGKRYILLGTGFGAYRSAKPNPILGNWMSDVEDGRLPMVCVCGKGGEVGWLDSREIVVDTVDGQSLESLLK